MIIVLSQKNYVFSSIFITIMYAFESTEDIYNDSNQ